AVAVLDGSADPGGWKALRGAMGSTFRLPVGRLLRQDLMDRARARGLRVVAAAARGGRPLSEVDLRPPTVVLLGSEGAGLDENALAASDATLTVPMRAGVESLNV